MLGTTTNLEVRTPEGVAFRIPVASPFSRCLALGVDFAAVLVLVMLLSLVLGSLSHLFLLVPVVGEAIADFGTGLMILLQFLVFVLYGMVMEGFCGGQTLGKRLFKLRVIDERGLSLGWKQVVIRNLFRMLDILPSQFYLIGGIACFVTRKCQRLGDIAAGTLVIRETAPQPPELEGLVAGGGNVFRSAPHLEDRLRRLTSPEEARIALDALTRRDEIEPESRLRLFGRLAEHFRGIAEFPGELTEGLSDEQYVRNVVDTLFRRTTV